MYTVKSFASRLEAELAKSKLQSERIESYISADDLGGMSFFFQQGVDLKVAKEDLQAACRILEEEAEDS